MIEPAAPIPHRPRGPRSPGQHRQPALQSRTQQPDLPAQPGPHRSKPPTPTSGAQITSHREPRQSLTAHDHQATTSSHPRSREHSNPICPLNRACIVPNRQYRPLARKSCHAGAASALMKRPNMNRRPRTEAPERTRTRPAQRRGNYHAPAARSPRWIASGTRRTHPARRPSDAGHDGSLTACRPPPRAAKTCQPPTTRRFASLISIQIIRRHIPSSCGQVSEPFHCVDNPPKKLRTSTFPMPFWATPPQGDRTWQHSVSAPPSPH